MIATWLKIITLGDKQPAVEYAEDWKKSSFFEEAWLLEVPEEVYVIGLPKSVWYTGRGMYWRKDIRDIVPVVMGLPMPRVTGLMCCIWTRREQLTGSVTQMRAVEDTEEVKQEVAILWNWIGHIMRQSTTVQRKGGLAKEFDTWLRQTDPVLPTTPNSPPPI